MSSTAQVEANRQNCLKSTGPVTPDGKARACLNAVTHGLLSGKVLIAGEDAAAFAEHCRSMKESLAPVGAMEELLADQVAAQAWRLRRAMALETRALDETLGRFGILDDDVATGVVPGAEAGACPSEDAGARQATGQAKGAFRAPTPVPPQVAGGVVRDFLQTGTRGLDVLRRYGRAIEQAFYQAMRELRAIQAARREEERHQAAHARSRRRQEQGQEQEEEQEEEQGPLAPRDRNDYRRSMVEAMIAREEAIARDLEERVRSRKVLRTAEVAAAEGSANQRTARNETKPISGGEPVLVGAGRGFQEADEAEEDDRE